MCLDLDVHLNNMGRRLDGLANTYSPLHETIWRQCYNCRYFGSGGMHSVRD
ncbi:hypothetical protein DPMN_070016 [Dreissena polymorpha]|uniref:Uncharacterized protein n=1 Tax=Dreissena polymorpha TaxID=45954 RepID=A0A9D3Z592_DREPO|nr:hypothetical protein DPMN_070016 [Dreissena polymorpha]